MKRTSTKIRNKKAERARRRNSSRESWYSAVLAFMAIAWPARRNKNPNGTLFKQYYVIRARDIRSAFREADHILHVSEHLDGSGKLDGKRVIFKAIGILDLMPLLDTLESGAEIYDESEIRVRYKEVRKHLLSNRRKARMIAFERKNGKLNPIDVYWGKEFNRL